MWSLTEYNGELIVGGDFITAGEQEASSIASWDGTTWSSLGSNHIARWDPWAAG